MTAQGNKEGLVALTYDGATGETMVMDANGNTFVASSPEQIGLICLKILHDPTLPRPQRTSVAQTTASRNPQPVKKSTTWADLNARVSSELEKFRRLTIGSPPLPRQNKSRAEANRRQQKRTESGRDRRSVLNSRRTR